jgi:hypothetical protein
MNSSRTVYGNHTVCFRLVSDVGQATWLVVRLFECLANGQKGDIVNATMQSLFFELGIWSCRVGKRSPRVGIPGNCRQETLFKPSTWLPLMHH